MYNIIYSILKYILAVIVLKQLTKETYQIKTKYARMEAHNLLIFTSWVGPITCFITDKNKKSFINQNNLTKQTVWYNKTFIYNNI